MIQQSRENVIIKSTCCIAISVFIRDDKLAFPLPAVSELDSELRVVNPLHTWCLDDRWRQLHAFCAEINTKQLISCYFLFIHDSVQ